MLVVVGLMLVEPSARSLPVGIALLAIILGWLLCSLMGSKSANTVSVANEAASAA
jgi:flagellar biosynthesis protein FliP